jgi:protein-S-isoprenylcysteine O-methyltransferase Ste14
MIYIILALIVLEIYFLYSYIKIRIEEKKLIRKHLIDRLLASIREQKD